MCVHKMCWNEKLGFVDLSLQYTSSHRKICRETVLMFIAATTWRESGRPQELTDPQVCRVILHTEERIQVEFSFLCSSK